MHTACIYFVLYGMVSYILLWYGIVSYDTHDIVSYVRYDIIYGEN